MRCIGRVGLCAIGVLGFAGVSQGALIYPGVNNASSAVGLSTPIRTVPRVFQTFVDRSTLGEITQQSEISSLSFRLPPSYSTGFSGSIGFPVPGTTGDISTTRFEIVLAKPSTAAAASGTLSSATFADNMSSPVVVRTGPLTIPAGSFKDTNTGPGPAGSAEFSYTINFDTNFVINPGEDLVVLIRQAGFTYTGSTAPSAINFDTFDKPGALRVATDSAPGGVNATAANDATTGRHMKFAFDVTPVPEPTSAAALVAAGGMMALRRRRTK